jgi:mycothiol S-conjugate amidase
VLNASYGTPLRPMKQIRRDELAAATAILGYSAVYMLGYEDSGMPDSRANENPACFARAPLRHATGRLVQIMRRERPDVVITYPEDGGYGHPDHLRVHEVSLAAVHASADPTAFPAAGDPFSVPKLYYSARSRARMAALAEAYERLGLDFPFRDRVRQDVGQDDSHITSRIDVGELFEVRRDALLAHATQIGPDSFWMRLPLGVAREAYPHEDYSLALSSVPVRFPENDLFAGIPG